MKHRNLSIELLFGGGGSLPLSGYFALRAQYAATPSSEGIHGIFKVHILPCPRRAARESLRNIREVPTCHPDVKAIRGCHMVKPGDHFIRFLYQITDLLLLINGQDLFHIFDNARHQR